MKRVIKYILLFLFMVPVIVNAGTFSSEVSKANNYVEKNNFKNSYKRYLINGGTIPFVYNNGTLSSDSSFTKGGFLSISEYNASKKNGSSYLFDGTEYWTLSKSGSNIYAITYDSTDEPKSPSSSYQGRVTEYVKPGTKVRGSGSLNDPWNFSPVYKVTIIADDKYATITQSENNVFVRGMCNESDCKASIGIQGKSNYRYITNGCNGYYNESTKKFELINVRKDTTCKVIFGVGAFEIKLNGATPNKIYLMPGDKYYTSSIAQTEITQLINNPSKEGHIFRGFKTSDGVTIVDQNGRINLSSVNSITGPLELDPLYEVRSYTLTIDPNGGDIDGHRTAYTETLNYGTVKQIPKPNTVYTISYDMGTTGITAPTSPVSATRTFKEWNVSGAKSTEIMSNGVKVTIGAQDATVQATYYAPNSITLPSLNKNYYTCKWAEGSVDGEQFDGRTSRQISSNITYYAICTPNNYTLTVNPNGGTWEGSTNNQQFSQQYGTTKTISNPTGYYRITYNMQSTGITAPTSPTTAARDFSSWSLSGAGSFSGSTYTFGGGSGTLNAQYASTSHEFTLPPISKEGYTCKWGENGTGGTQYAGGTTRTINYNTTYYAVCNPNTYTLTINPNGGNYNGFTTSQQYSVNYGSSKYLYTPSSTYNITYNMGTTGITAPTSPTTAGRTFSSWALTGNGRVDGNYYYMGVGDATLKANYNTTSNSFSLPYLYKQYYTCKWAEGSASGTQYAQYTSRTITSDTTYYAVCVDNLYKLTVNPNGGTWEGSTENQEFNQARNTTKVISNPTSGATYTITYDGNSQGATYTASPTSVKRNFSSWSFGGYGSFNSSTSTVTFGTGSSTLTAQYNSTSNSFTLPAITKTGYSCRWAEGSTTGTQYAGGTTRTITGNKTYYAVCKYNSLMGGTSGYSSSVYLRTTIARQDIEKVTFTNSLAGHTANGIDCWDVSEDENGSVLAWSSDTDSNGKYELTIGSNTGGIVYASTGNYLFYNLNNLTTIDGMQYFNTSNVTSMSYMFSGCYKLVSIDLSHFDTSKVTSMSSMFSSCNALTSLNLSNFNTSKVTSMSNMFNSCNKLETLNLSNFNTSNVTDMSYMFSYNYAVTTLNLNTFDTSKVRYMYYMFSSCSKLETLSLSNFNTSNVTNFNSMFSGCSKLTSLDISSFVINNTPTSMFDGSGLKQLKTPTIESGTIKLGSIMYDSNDNQIETLTTSTPSNTWLRTHAVLAKGQDFNKLVKQASGQTNATYTTNNTTIKKIQVYSGTPSSSILANATDVSDTSSNDSIYAWFDTDTIYLYSTRNPIEMNQDSSSLFYNMKGLTNISFSGLNTASMKNMSSMFSGCTGLTSLNLSGLNISNVTSMSSMFSGCTGLTSLNLSGLNTSNVTSMDYMFRGCTSLTSLNLSGFNTSNLQVVSYMFNGCSNLTNLNLSNFDTTKLTSNYNTTAVFANSSNLNTITVTNCSSSTKSKLIDMLSNSNLYFEELTTGVLTPYTPSPATFTVVSVENISTNYGFALNANGYYESNNQGVHSSYALAKVTINVTSAGAITFDVINSGEGTCDYGIFSTIDKTLSSSSNADSSNVQKSFSGLSSTSVQNVMYGNVPTGQHYITIKYRKDGSVDSGNDSLQFKIHQN